MEKVGTVQLKRSVGEDLAAKIKFGLVEVVYEWAKGMVSVSRSGCGHVLTNIMLLTSR